MIGEGWMRGCEPADRSGGEFPLLVCGKVVEGKGTLVGWTVRG